MMLLLSEVEILVDNHLLLLVEFEMLTLSDCSSSVRKKFVKKIAALSEEGYSEFTGVKKGKAEGMNILVKQKGDTINEVVAVSAGDNSCIGILITGDINAEDVAAIIGMVDDSRG